MISTGTRRIIKSLRGLSVVLGNNDRIIMISISFDIIKTIFDICKHREFRTEFRIDPKKLHIVAGLLLFVFKSFSG